MAFWVMGELINSQVLFANGIQVFRYESLI